MHNWSLSLNGRETKPKIKANSTVKQEERYGTEPYLPSISSHSECTCSPPPEDDNKDAESSGSDILERLSEQQSIRDSEDVAPASEYLWSSRSPSKPASSKKASHRAHIVGFICTCRLNLPCLCCAMPAGFDSKIRSSIMGSDG